MNVEERARRSADHSTRNQSGVNRVHGPESGCDDRDWGSHGIRCAGKARSEQASALAPLSEPVGSALLVLAQPYLAIPLAPVIGEVFESGGAGAAAALGTSCALASGVGFLTFGPLSDRYGRLTFRFFNERAKSNEYQPTLPFRRLVGIRECGRNYH
jgi:hypothetical protein